VVTRSGGPEVLALQDVAEPQPQAGEVLVRVEAAGVNFADISSAAGRYTGGPKPPFVAGREFAGVVESSSERVMGYAEYGAFAERVAAKAHRMWPQPQGWTAEESAAFPVNYFTTYFLYQTAGLLPQQRAALPESQRNRRPAVLIHAAAGGVGTAAVEIGHLLGVETIGTSSSDEKLARLKKLGLGFGLDHGINYTRLDYEEEVAKLTKGAGVDAAFEMLGGEHTAKSTRCLREFGRVVIYGTATGQQPKFDTLAMYAKNAGVHGFWLSRMAGNREQMALAWEWLTRRVAEGKLRPAIGHRLPLAEAAEAYRLLLERRNFGKVILTMP
jgi:NADPH2:quinone reductase